MIAKIAETRILAGGFGFWVRKIGKIKVFNKGDCRRFGELVRLVAFALPFAADVAVDDGENKTDRRGISAGLYAFLLNPKISQKWSRVCHTSCNVLDILVNI